MPKPTLQHINTHDHSIDSRYGNNHLFGWVTILSGGWKCTILVHQRRECLQEVYSIAPPVPINELNNLAGVPTMIPSLLLRYADQLGTSPRFYGLWYCLWFERSQVLHFASPRIVRTVQIFLIQVHKGSRKILFSRLTV